MADDLENPGEWRDTVDARLSTLEARVDEEARLRAAMDEDLSHLHVERNMLQALHDTQGDHTKRLTSLETKMDAVKGTLDEVHAGVDLITRKLDSLIGADS